MNTTNTTLQPTLLTFGTTDAIRQPTLRELPRHEQPRTRVCAVGAEYCSDAELLAALLGTGTKDLDAMQLAQRILVDTGGWLGLQRVSAAELRRFPGMTEAKAAQVKAALAIGKRLITRPEERLQITSPADVSMLLMAEMASLEQEHLKVVALSTKNHVIKVITVYIGSINSSAVRICEVFKEALRANAASIILSHNHPSSDPTPSPEDLAVTRQCVQAGQLLGIEVLDHLVIGQGRYVSMRERGLGFSS